MPPEWTLRPGREDDIRAMYILDLVCFDEPFRFDLRSMRRFARHPGALVVVAEADAALVGFVVAHLVRRGRRRVGYVVTLDVAPEFRRLGLAHALMSAAELQAAAESADTMALHVYAGNAPAVAFYEHFGYSRGAACPSFYGKGLDGWIYTKPLTSS
jgi:ribosomal-protein-alanine N-acetyltransferase